MVDGDRFRATGASRCWQHIAPQVQSQEKTPRGSAAAATRRSASDTRKADESTRPDPASNLFAIDLASRLTPACRMRASAGCNRGSLPVLRQRRGGRPKSPAATCSSSLNMFAIGCGERTQRALVSSHCAFDERGKNPAQSVDLVGLVCAPLFHPAVSSVSSARMRVCST